MADTEGHRPREGKLGLGLPRGEQRGGLTLSSFMCLFKENFLDPEVHVDAGDCYRNKKDSPENTARQRRALKAKEEEEEEEKGAGEKRQIWVAL